MDIDWLSAESLVLLNPRMPADEGRRLTSFVIDLPGHVWLSTSGTSGSLKLAALSKRALLVSAAAVNRHLSAGPEDVWCNVLPTFHVGGLGILARAFLSRAKVVSDLEEGVTLAAFVPAHVSDIVRARRVAPESLRAVIVGGGLLSEELYTEGRALGWPLLPSYGMTECASQVATAVGSARALVILDHVEVREETDGRLALRSEALLSGYGTEAGFIDPKVEGWLITEDLGVVEGQTLRVIGRGGDFVKVGGESVDLSRLDQILALITAEAAVIAVPDDRLGSVIHLAVTADAPATVVEQYNANVFPYERARGIRRVQEIPRTPLGKLMRTRLR